MCCACLGGCKMMDRREEYVPPRPPKNFKTASAAVTRTDRINYEAANRFSVRLLQAADFGASGKPEALSPAGAFVALSLLLNGAQSDTFEALCKVLGLTDPNLERLNQSNAHLLDVLEAQATQTNWVAQSLWSVAPVKFSPRYVDDMKTWYSADVRRLGSAGDNAYKQIKDWIDTKGNGATSHELRPLSKDDDCFVLISAVFIDLALKTGYCKEEDVKRGDVSSLTFQNPTSRVIESELAQVIEFPLSNPSMTAWLVVPKRENKISAIIRSFTAETWTKWGSSPEKKSIRVTLRWPSALSATDLNSAIKKLGGQSLYSPESDFTSMSHETKSGFWLSRFSQFCSKGLILSMAPLPKQVSALEIVPNGPYALFVVENVTGTLLLAATGP